MYTVPSPVQQYYMYKFSRLELQKKQSRG